MTIQQVSPDGQLDSFLTMFDSFGFEIASNDDSAFSLDSEVVLAVIPGETLFVQAGSFPGSFGSFDLLIQTGDEFVAGSVDVIGDVDGNAEAFTLDPVFNDFFVVGDLETSSDRDVYTTTFAEAGTVTVNLGSIEVVGALDPLLRVRDSGDLEVVDDDGGLGLDSQTVLVVSAGDQLFFDVGSFASASSGEYLLDVLFQPGAIADDFPDESDFQSPDGSTNFGAFIETL